MIVNEFHIQAFQKLIEPARRIILTTHRSPDGDGLGALCALADFFNQIGIESLIIYKDVMPQKYSFLKNTRSFVALDTVTHLDGDLIVVCDVGDTFYAGLEEIFSKLSKHVSVINFDHHDSNTLFGDLNIIDCNASSTCEVVYYLLKTCNAIITPSMATALLLGIIADTGNFSNPSTTSSSFEVAALLLESGADQKQIIKTEFNTYTIGDLKLWGKALSRLHGNSDLSLVMTYLLWEDFSQNPFATAEGISNFMNNIPSVGATVFLKEEQRGTVKGSLRTTGECDVSKIARFFGGGGHKKSAGFTIKGSLKVVNGRVTVL